MLIGALAGLVANARGLGLGPVVGIGTLAAITSLASTTVLLVRHVNATWPRSGKLLANTTHHPSPKENAR
ncbi:MAG: hypothetical protein ACRDWI_19090 [Jiangellaceae bacterium]